jgi:CRISPR-associated protein Cmr1
MRRPPDIVLPEVTPRRDAGLIAQSREYELITPLFGGGVNPGEADPVTVIRGQSVRGQLRFWWRACRGGLFQGNLDRMRKAEDSLWGAAGSSQRTNPSKVQIAVETTDHGHPNAPFEYSDKWHPRARAEWKKVAYAAFPLQPSEEEARNRVPPKTVCTGVSFLLKLEFPEDALGDVEAALWAWETFGGIGGRTRRGFGALRLAVIDGRTVPAPAAAEIAVNISSLLEKHVAQGEWPDGVPHLRRDSQSFRLTEPAPGALSAWQHLIEEYKNFRQARPDGRDGRPGRNKWPEPDAVRHLTGRSAPQHRQPISDVNKFPRASFGLPIIFHFKDRDDPPPTNTLKGVDHDRLASPLLLRPLACAGGETVGLAVILTAPVMPPGGLVLEVKPRGGRARSYPVSAQLGEAEAARIPPLKNHTDPLGAFLSTLSEKKR